MEEKGRKGHSQSEQMRLSNTQKMLAMLVQLTRELPNPASAKVRVGTVRPPLPLVPSGLPVAEIRCIGS